MNRWYWSGLAPYVCVRDEWQCNEEPRHEKWCIDIRRTLHGWIYIFLFGCALKTLVASQHHSPQHFRCNIFFFSSHRLEHKTAKRSWRTVALALKIHERIVLIIIIIIIIISFSFFLCFFCRCDRSTFALDWIMPNMRLLLFPLKRTVKRFILKRNDRLTAEPRNHRWHWNMKARAPFFLFGRRLCNHVDD